MRFFGIYEYIKVRPRENYKLKQAKGWYLKSSGGGRFKSQFLEQLLRHSHNPRHFGNKNSICINSIEFACHTNNYVK